MNLILRRNWLKDFLIGLVFSILIFVFTFLPVIKNSTIASQINSFYIDSGVDYEIPSPSRSQVLEIEGFNYIEFVDPFFKTTIPVKVVGQSSECTGSVFLVDHGTSEWGPYIESRLIKGDIQEGSIGAFIDESFALENDVKIGDEILLTLEGVDFNFPVLAEFETSLNQGETFPSIVFFSTSQDYIDILSGYSYSGAYVGTIDRELATEYFKNEYKPLGQVGNPEDYASEELYQSALDFILESDYSAVVQSFNDIGTDILDPQALQDNSRLLFIIGTLLIIGYSAFVFIWRVCSKSSMALWRREGKLGVFKGHIARKIVVIGLFEIIVCLLVVLFCYFIASIFITGDIYSSFKFLVPIYLIAMLVVAFITASSAVNKIVGMNKLEMEKELARQRSLAEAENEQKKDLDNPENKSADSEIRHDIPTDK